MSDFAKLFRTEKHGQILVKLDESPDEGKPEVRFYVQPPHLGVCTVGLGFQDNDEGWDKAEAAFARIDEAEASKFADKIFASAEELTAGAPHGD